MSHLGSGYALNAVETDDLDRSRIDHVDAPKKIYGYAGQQGLTPAI